MSESSYLRDCREIALGVLGWSPKEFRQATPWEFNDAWAGWKKRNMPEGPKGLSKFHIEQIQKGLANKDQLEAEYKERREERKRKREELKHGND